jgi:hypothetical protein
MSKWYYLVDGQAAGPIDSASLKSLADSGLLQPQDKVRRADLAKWYMAIQVQGLFSIDQSQATFAATEAGRSDPVSSSSKAGTNRTRRIVVASSGIVVSAVMATIVGTAVHIKGTHGRASIGSEGRSVADSPAIDPSYESESHLNHGEA